MSLTTLHIVQSKSVIYQLINVCLFLLISFMYLKIYNTIKMLIFRGSLQKH